MDDPLLWGILDATYFRNQKRLRWTLCAQEICFINKLQARFISAGQGIPVIRGRGIHQPGMDQAIDVLNANGWVHLFPEGKVNEQPNELLPFKWGVARLVRESRLPPIVVPIYHRGMNDILPTTHRWNRLHFNKQLDVAIGDPLDFAKPGYREWRSYCDTGVMDDAGTRAEITRYLHSQMQILKCRVTNLVAARPPEPQMPAAPQLIYSW
ncbi:hypothetical protein HDU91_007400 [Kappamyces sp. JEL0680]|nr:hypothetical protein HDU91_007400 [Kappamyces sp. JEL0680]